MGCEIYFYDQFSYVCFKVSITEETMICNFDHSKSFRAWVIDIRFQLKTGIALFDMPWKEVVCWELWDTKARAASCEDMQGVGGEMV